MLNVDLLVSVRDTGIGSAPEHLGTVLQPFGQVDSPKVRQDRGTGLGLPICRS
ncbi:ATP-binding protein [Azospirillum canadense]|uniref:ATP-binding protein n=1 Tax=Azospirillum canadense TaxID=403962 RepID=UPI0022268C46|nr:ATP-binding protein [Azospirillum canadense]MCW2239486.1 signal transduction histidine kinase [Azospirillum canadense]